MPFAAIGPVTHIHTACTRAQGSQARHWDAPLQSRTQHGLASGPADQGAARPVTGSASCQVGRLHATVSTLEGWARTFCTSSVSCGDDADARGPPLATRHPTRLLAQRVPDNKDTCFWPVRLCSMRCQANTGGRGPRREGAEAVPALGSLHRPFLFAQLPSNASPHFRGFPSRARWLTLSSRDRAGKSHRVTECRVCCAVPRGWRPMPTTLA